MVFSSLLRTALTGRRLATVGALGGGGALFAAGSASFSAQRELPDGLPRACCVDASGVSACEPASGAEVGSLGSLSDLRVSLSSKEDLGGGSGDLVAQLRAIVGDDHVHTDADSSQPLYLQGARLGSGAALAVVRPGTLQEAVHSLQAVAAAGAVVVPQGANTGLTGGSVPKSSAEKYGGRECVVINMRRIRGVHTLREACDDHHGEHDHIRYLCLAGTGIHTLSCLAKEQGRESHSILGSTFLNPTVAAGLAFGSGGTQMRKGPVFTERALWCSINESGEVELHDTTGLDLLVADENRTAADDNEKSNGVAEGVASDAERYRASICHFDESAVARFNADTTGIDPVRSEGKVLILASVHDSFPAPRQTKLFWVSCDSLETAQRLKQKVCLADKDDLPVACEYMDRDAIDVVDEAGRVLCHSLLRQALVERDENVGASSGLRPMAVARCQICASTTRIAFCPPFCPRRSRR